MKRVMIGSVIMICALVIWGFFAHTAWSQANVISAILGQGIPGFIPEFTDQQKIADSVIFQDANGNVGVGTTSPNAKLNANQVGDASGSDSLVNAVRGDATGSATGVNSEVDAVRGQTTGSAVGDGSELDAVAGRSFGDASGPDSQVTGVRGRASGNATGQGAAVVAVRGRSSGSATGPNSVTVGVSGTANGTPTGLNSTAIGVVGGAPAPSGNTVGVRGISGSPDGLGVHGINLATSGHAVGVFGQTSSLDTSGVGVLGQGPFRGVIGSALADSGFTEGVEGTVSSPAGTAVHGITLADSGTPIAVRGEARTPNGIGVWGGSPSGLAGLFDGKVQINCPTFPCVTINGIGFLDMAENLPLAAHVAPGDVVVVAEGKGGYGIAPASLPYDTRVAGIVSEHSPILLQDRQREQAAPVAMVGVVRAKATAANGPIRLGDLLTTSRIPGHLMRCPTPLQCVGAVIGKALEPLAKGEKQILVMLWRQ